MVTGTQYHHAFKVDSQYHGICNQIHLRDRSVTGQLLHVCVILAITCDMIANIWVWESEKIRHILGMGDTVYWCWPWGKCGETGQRSISVELVLSTLSQKKGNTPCARQWKHRSESGGIGEQTKNRTQKEGCMISEVRGKTQRKQCLKEV